MRHTIIRPVRNSPPKRQTEREIDQMLKELDVHLPHYFVQGFMTETVDPDFDEFFA